MNKTQMIDSLTAMRLFFAMMVFGTHCYVIDDFFNVHLFKEGFVGVSFFFVLSGFIIAYNYQERLRTQQITKRSFWVARIARVYPLHWLTLLIAALLGGYVVVESPADWIRHFLASLTLTNAYVPDPTYFFSFNSPSWSLCCEQLFYVSFPLLIPLATYPKRLLGLFASMALLVLIGMHFTPEAEIKAYWYVNPITRFPDFILGMLLYQLYERMKALPLTRMQGTLWEIGSILLFLTHLFILLTFANWQKGSEIDIAWYLSVPILFCIALGLSVLSYHYFERPMNKRIKSLLN